MRKRNRGSAVVEAALMMPWIAFLFIGVFDFGFYAYASICTQNAARAVAVAVASGAPAPLCQTALDEFSGLPNMGGVASCGIYPSDVTAAQPVTACTATLASSGSITPNSDPSCSSSTQCADCTLDTSATSIQATVAYQTPPLVPIPGILMGRMTMTRTAEIRVIQ